MIWLELYGIGLGGDFKNSLWQLWPGVMLHSMTLAVVGKLSIETGAWPMPPSAPTPRS